MTPAGAMPGTFTTKLQPYVYQPQREMLRKHSPKGPHTTVELRGGGSLALPRSRFFCRELPRWSPETIGLRGLLQVMLSEPFERQGLRIFLRKKRTPDNQNEKHV